jgi:hypothetical protein
MTLLTRQQILEAEDIQREVVSVPEWGGDVLVQGLTGIDRDAFEKSQIDLNANSAATSTFKYDNIRANLLARTIVDEHGARLFTDADIKALGKKSALAMQRVFDVAQRLSGLTKSDIDELAKNSSDDQRGALPID